MKTAKLLIVILISAISVQKVLAQTNLNFENWTGNEPNGWTSSNDLTTQGGGAQTVFKEAANPGQGSASLKMVTGSCPQCPTYISDMTWGMVDCTLPNPYGGSISYGTVLVPGMPYTQRPISVDFLYKSNPSGNDAGGFGIELTKYNPVTDETETIGEAIFTSEAVVNKWTQMNIPVVYYSSNTPDTLNIYATSSIGTTMDCSNSIIFPNMPSPYNDWGLPYPVTGSEFYIDAIVINLPSCSGFTLTITGTKETGIGANDGTATASPIGGTAPYSYSWSNLATTQSINGLVPGYYFVTVTDANQCQKAGSYFVAPGGCNLSVSVTGTNSSTNSIYTGNGTAVATASGGTPPYNFEWSTGQITTGASSSSVSNLPVGTYAVLVTEQNNPLCALWGYITVFGPSGGLSGVKDNIFPKSSVIIHPNPGNGIFSLGFNKKISKIEVNNVLGENIYSHQINSDKAEINLNTQPRGIYFLTLLINDNIISVEKLIIE